MANTLSESEQEKLVELRRIKVVATGVLILCFAVLIVTKLLESRWPGLGFIAAFAEAATIGGIADWYAVVALFKKPMNLPIPHTAIIPNNQARIGDNLGRFIERNFLSSDTVGEKLREIRFADEMANWLANEKKSEELARFAAKLVPSLLEAADQSGMRTFAAEQVKRQLEKTEVAPIAANILDAFVKDGHHEKLLDDLIEGLRTFLNDDVTLETIKIKVQEELPSLLYIVQAEGPILRRIVKAAGSLLDDVKADPDHPMREEFHKFLKSNVRHMKRSRRFARRVEAMKSDILARPELAGIAERLWATLRDYLEKDVLREDSTTIRRMSAIFNDIGRNLQKETELKAEIDREMVRILSELVESQKGTVSGFISEQVKGWDFAQLTLLIEANVGKDLQYIRFNGMIIGGIAGVVLHSILVLLGGV